MHRRCVLYSGQQGKCCKQTESTSDGIKCFSLFKHVSQEEYNEVQEEKGKVIILLPVYLVINETDQNDHGNGIDKKPEQEILCEDLIILHY